MAGPLFWRILIIDIVGVPAVPTCASSANAHYYTLSTHVCYLGDNNYGYSLIACQRTAVQNSLM